jgi:NADPH:quinone reductase-like Zn-dependent oxidoreductase
MTKAYKFEKLTGLAGLQQSSFEPETVGKGEVLVKVRAVALNRRDLLIAENNYPGKVKAGCIPCSDAAGEIVSIGPEVKNLKVGDRVISLFHPTWFGGRMPSDAGIRSYGNVNDGWLCEYKVVSENAVLSFPESLNWNEAATLPCAGVTAWTALSGTTPIRAGDSVLTLGTGGVSIFAIQIARKLGATIYSTTSSNHKGEQLRKLGAVHIINYKEHDDWGNVVKERSHGIGVDRVVEVVGGDSVNQSLDALRYGGEIALIGQLSPEGGGLDPAKIKARGANLRSIAVGDKVAAQAFLDMVVATHLKPVIDKVYSFNDVPAAFKALDESRHVGKIVISLD